MDKCEKAFSVNTTKEDSILVDWKSGSKVDKCEKAFTGIGHV